MKDLLKQYISKGYKPTFYNCAVPIGKGEIKIAVKIYAPNCAEKLELYLMRDWLEEEKGYFIDSEYNKSTERFSTYDFAYNKNSRDYDSRPEAIKSALEEAIKHI